MEIESIVVVAAALLYLGLTIYLANLQDRSGQRGPILTWLLLGAAGLTIFTGLTVLVFAMTGASIQTNLPAVSQTGAIAFVILAALAGGYGILVSAIPATRLLLRRILGPDASFDPLSSVHTTAVVLSLSLLVINAAQLVFSGGVEGMAEIIKETGISPGELTFQGILWIVVALLGVGLAIRRSPAEAAQRLGLRIPTRADVTVGILSGLGLVAVQLVIGGLWTAFTTPELLQQQTAAAEQIQLAINTLPLALLVSATAAIGEEIFFRGALQPVFGIVLTSVVFALFHNQYALTPASALIVVVAVGFGLLRRRYSTSASIIAHFVYNFVPLTLVLLAGAATGSP